MKNYIIFLFVITLIVSCADDDEQYRMECNYKLTGLELRNDILKQELDSIKSIIKNENISVLTFANTMSGNIIANDSAEFLVSIAYERPSLVRKMTYSISQNIDSIDHYLNNSNYQMNVIEYNDSKKFKGFETLNLNDFEKGKYYLFGNIYFDASFRVSRMPFKMDFEVE